MPQNLQILSVNSTSIQLRWDAPLDVEQNGPITSYQVYYTGMLFDTTQQGTEVQVPLTVQRYPLSNSSGVTITGLQEYNNVTISVSAVNGAGQGTAADIVVLTDIAG